MKRIKDWFLHNTLLKLGSLVLAFIVWLLVVNSSNPQVSGNVTIPFDVLNEKTIVTAGQVYSLSAYDVNVTYKVRSKFKSQIATDAFSAYINLDDYSITGAVPIYLEIDSSISDLITDVSINPTVIHVSTEMIQQKKFAVKPMLEGEVAEGYMAGDLEVSPEYIYVKGPVSVMGKITDVGVSINVNNANNDLNGTATVFFLDANGNPLNGIEDSLSFAGDISYHLPVYRIKTLTVNAFTGGAPASGYMVDSVETSPTFISVYGPEDILNQYSYILIPGNAINVAGANENRTFNIPTSGYIPNGLSLATQTPEITVYVKIRSIFEDSKKEPSTSTVTVTETISTETEHTSESSYAETSEEVTSSEETTDSTETETVQQAEETSPQRSEE